MRVTARLGECLFRPLTDSDRDTDFVLALRNHPRFRPWFYSAVPSREAHLKFLEKVRAGDDILWLIEEAGEPVAISSIYHFDWTNRKCECGRIASLSPKCFAVNFVICATIIFESLELNKAYIETLETNTIIARGVERMGMTREGLLRDHVCRDGKFLNVLFYGITATDWFGHTRQRLTERYGAADIVSVER